MQFIFDAKILHLFDESSGIFRSGKFFFKCMKAETIMNTLIQDSPKFFIPFQDQDILDSISLADTAAASPAGRRR